MRLLLGAVEESKESDFIRAISKNEIVTFKWLYGGIAHDWVQSFEARMQVAALTTGMRTTPREILWDLM